MIPVYGTFNIQGDRFRTVRNHNNVITLNTHNATKTMNESKTNQFIKHLLHRYILNCHKVYTRSVNQYSFSVDFLF